MVLSGACCFKAPFSFYKDRVLQTYDTKYKIPGEYAFYEYKFFEEIPQKREGHRKMYIMVSELTHLNGKKKYLITMDWLRYRYDHSIFKPSCTRNETAINFTPSQFRQFYTGLFKDVLTIGEHVIHFDTEFVLSMHKTEDVFPPKHAMIQCQGIQFTSDGDKRIPINETMRRGFFLDEIQIDYILDEGANILKYA